MALIQNFSVRAGNSQAINFDVGPDDSTPSYIGMNIQWTVYQMSVIGQPDLQNIVLQKVLDDGLQIDDPETHKFHVDLSRGDTLDLVGNYYHLAQVIDADGNYTDVTLGVMTVI